MLQQVSSKLNESTPDTNENYSASTDDRRPEWDEEIPNEALWEAMTMQREPLTKDHKAMGRKKRRTWSADRFYHVVCRGALFKEKSDFETFLYILQQLYNKYPFELASYCFMTNHYHLQMRSREQPLSKVMDRSNENFCGSFFEREWPSALCQNGSDSRCQRSDICRIR